jgi:hypothetical protein
MKETDNLARFERGKFPKCRVRLAGDFGRTILLSRFTARIEFRRAAWEIELRITGFVCVQRDLARLVVPDFPFLIFMNFFVYFRLSFEFEQLSGLKFTIFRWGCAWKCFKTR